jgi:hypothetical protein
MFKKIEAIQMDSLYFCDPDWIRTNDLQLRRLPLYPAELRDRKNLGLQR